MPSRLPSGRGASDAAASSTVRAPSARPSPAAVRRSSTSRRAALVARSSAAWSRWARAAVTRALQPRRGASRPPPGPPRPPASRPRAAPRSSSRSSSSPTTTWRRASSSARCRVRRAIRSSVWSIAARWPTSRLRSSLTRPSSVRTARLVPSWASRMRATSASSRRSSASASSRRPRCSSLCASPRRTSPSSASRSRASSPRPLPGLLGLEARRLRCAPASSAFERARKPARSSAARAVGHRLGDAASPPRGRRRVPRCARPPPRARGARARPAPRRPAARAASGLGQRRLDARTRSAWIER